MPRAIDSLGTPDGSWADGATIPGSSIAYGECVLTIELEIAPYDDGADQEGCIFEYGDASAGISFAFEADNRVRFRCGNSTDSLEFEERMDNPALAHFVQGATYEVTLHIQPASGRVDLYYEGVFIKRYSGTIGDWSTSSDGAVGQVNGAHFAHSSTVGIPGTRSSTWDIVTGLRYWDGGSPTIEFTANSKAFFPVEVKDAMTSESIFRSESIIADEWGKYFYAKSDFADIRSPGVVFEVNDMQFVWEWYRNSSSRGGNGNPAHGAVLFKSGETLGLERKDHFDAYPSRKGRAMICGIDGESRTRPFVIMRYGGTDPITIDLTAATADSYRDLHHEFHWSYWIMEDRIFDVHCSTTYDGQHGTFTFKSNTTFRYVRVGGYRIQDCPLRPLGFSADTMSGTEDNKHITLGEFSIVRAQRGGSNGSLFGHGRHDADGGIKFVQIGRSLFHNEYDPLSVHTHNMYIKGRIPYLHILGGWCPTGPGTVIKNDGNERSVFRDFIAWKRQNGTGASCNGNSDVFGTSIDRSEGSGDAGFSRKCFWVDCLIVDMDDYASGYTASIDCENENCIYLGEIDQEMVNIQRNGSSDQEAEGFSDTYRVGMHKCTYILGSGITCQVALTDNRALVDSLGTHGFIMSECLIVNHATSTRDMIRWQGDDVDGGVASGRFEDPRFKRCHFYNRGSGNLMDDNGTAYASLSAAAAGISEPMFEDCNEGEVTFASEPPSSDAVLDYFSDNGYADEDAVIAAIDAAYSDGWDTLPDPLKIENIFAHFASAVRPTNLNAANTGGAMPGVESGGNPPNIYVVQSPDDGDINLGNLALGSVQTVDLTIRNNASVPAIELTLGTIAVSAGGTLTTDPSDSVIEAGSSVTATITIDTATAGARAIVVQIPSNDPDNAVFTVNINATIVGADLAVTVADDPYVSGSEIELEGLIEGEGYLLTLDITNSGMSDLTLGTVMVGGRLMIAAGGDPSGEVLAPAESTSVEIEVDTDAVGPVSGSVSVPSDDPDSPWVVTVTGNVAASSNPSDDYTGPQTRQEYLSVAEFDAILSEILISAHILRQAVGTLSTEDKLVCIANASIDFDAVPWDGFKLDPDQPTAWPRKDRYGELILPGGEVQYPASLGGGEWSFLSLPREIRLGVAIQAAARAADQLEIDQSLKVTGLAAQGITGISGAGTSWATEGQIARQPSSRLHAYVRSLVHPYLARGAEMV
jgi:hypothetical protein